VKKSTKNTEGEENDKKEKKLKKKPSMKAPSILPPGGPPPPTSLPPPSAATGPMKPPSSLPPPSLPPPAHLLSATSDNLAPPPPPVMKKKASKRMDAVPPRFAPPPPSMAPPPSMIKEETSINSDSNNNNNTTTDSPPRNIRNVNNSTSNTNTELEVDDEDNDQSSTTTISSSLLLRSQNPKLRKFLYEKLEGQGLNWEPWNEVQPNPNLLSEMMRMEENDIQKNSPSSRVVNLDWVVDIKQPTQAASPQPLTMGNASGDEGDLPLPINEYVIATAWKYSESISPDSSIVSGGGGGVNGMKAGAAIEYDSDISVSFPDRSEPEWEGVMKIPAKATPLHVWGSDLKLIECCDPPGSLSSLIFSTHIREVGWLVFYMCSFVWWCAFVSVCSFLMPLIYILIIYLIINE
jgi:hypothetical protein